MQGNNAISGNLETTSSGSVVTNPSVGQAVGNFKDIIHTAINSVTVINTASFIPPPEAASINEFKGMDGKSKSFVAIADYFIGLSNETQTPVTNMKLQRLVYYAQAWHLAILKRELISEDFQAWVNGPVIPELYYYYLPFSWKPIIRDDLDAKKFEEIKTGLQEDTKRLLEDVCYEYFGMEAYELEKLTKNEDPWTLARKGIPEDEPSNNIIDKESIQKYYSNFIKDEQALSK